MYVYQKEPEPSSSHMSSPTKEIKAKIYQSVSDTLVTNQSQSVSSHVPHDHTINSSSNVDSYSDDFLESIDLEEYKYNLIPSTKLGYTIN